ncbi:hypothetical protein [Kineosporia succinea]|uniref:PPE family protein n=1 Tax=Kineosporia succinea TaxID=84632 RepID=A0ABT9P493_9ACTN|nr:hypothetical protein [Kineosporia succinea]MDP9827493.1 hypothetical protein [Kineosporia succinea]
MYNVSEQQDSAPLTAAAATWGRVVSILEGIGSGLQDAGSAMQDGWDPSVTDAAANFFTHVGAGAWSVDEWLSHARTNQTALEAMAENVIEAKRQVKTIYANYKVDYQAAVAEFARTSLEGDAPLTRTGDAAESRQSDLDSKLEEVAARYQPQMAAVMTTLAAAYISNGSSMREGSKYQGPVTAKDAPGASSGSSNNRSSSDGSRGSGNGGGSNRSNGGGDGNNTGTGTRRSTGDYGNPRSTPAKRPRSSTGDGTDTPTNDPSGSDGTGGTGSSTGSSGSPTGTGNGAPTGGGTGTGNGTGASTGNGSSNGTGTGTGTGVMAGTPIAGRPTPVTSTPAGSGNPAGSAP